MLFYHGYRYFLYVLIAVSVLSNRVVIAQPQDTPDPRAAQLITQLSIALSAADDKISTAQLLPILHKSLLNTSGDDLAREVKALSFKKARIAISKYAIPVQIARIEKTPAVSVGMGATLEQGTVYEYFLQPKDKATISAPVKIFFPADGSEPKVSHFGSL